MKYITFAIMVVLIFGVAASPVLSNGFAYAQTDEDQKYTEKEKKEQRSNESKQQKAEQRQAAEERDAQQRTAAQKLQEQRRAELAERNQALMDRLAAKEKASEERMQERIDNIQERSPMADAINRLNQANSLCGPGTIFDSETNSCVLDLVDSNDASTYTTTDNALYRGNVGGTIEPQIITPIQTGTYFDTLREVISEQKRSQDNLFRQITMLLNLVDSMCEDKVLVAGVSDGKLRCIDSDRAFNMHSRGLVTLVE